MDVYCKLEIIFDEFNEKFLNEDNNFVSQNITPDIFIVLIHLFKNDVLVFDCLRFLDEMREKYELKNWSNFFCTERQIAPFEKDIKQIYQFFITSRSEIRNYKLFMEYYFSYMSSYYSAALNTDEKYQNNMKNEDGVV